MRTRMLAAAGFAALAICLAGCGTATGIGFPAAGPPSDGGRYGSVADLNEALVKAGVECPNWDEHNGQTLASSSGKCDTKTVLAIFASDAKKEQPLEQFKLMGEIVQINLLVGENWTVNTPGAEELQEKLGGTIFKTAAKK